MNIKKIIEDIKKDDSLTDEQKDHEVLLIESYAKYDSLNSERISEKVALFFSNFSEISKENKMLVLIMDCMMESNNIKRAIDAAISGGLPEKIKDLIESIAKDNPSKVLM
jgi:hypothetical protein